MTSRQRVTKKARKRKAARGPGQRRAGRSRASGKQRKGLTLMASADDQRRPVDRILEYYRPLKKPITVRIDADVLAWFKRDGKRYQTRINLALRRVMEREMKAQGK